MSEWHPPKDPAKFAAWAENFVEKLPKYAEKLGISPEELKQITGELSEWKAEHVRSQQALLETLRERLRNVQPEERWHPLFSNAFARTPVTREPRRTEMLRLLEKWDRGNGADPRRRHPARH